MTLNVSNHNGKLLADNFLDLQLIPRWFFTTINRFLMFTDHDAQLTAGGQDGYGNTSRHM